MAAAAAGLRAFGRLAREVDPAELAANLLSHLAALLNARLADAASNTCLVVRQTPADQRAGKNCRTGTDSLIEYDEDGKYISRPRPSGAPSPPTAPRSCPRP